MLQREPSFRFNDRADAGVRLARELAYYRGHADACVLGLPRGGLPVAFAVAQELQLPLDIYLVRKLGVPGHEELAMGAIASGGVQVLHRPVIENLRITDEMIVQVSDREAAELQRRETEFRGGVPPIDLKGKVVILVDDGIATGSSMEAALVSLRQRHPACIVIAVPVAPRSTAARMRVKVDDQVVLCEVDDFRAVSEWYKDFAQVTDDQVRSLLGLSRRSARP